MLPSSPGEMIVFMSWMQMNYIMHKNGKMGKDVLNMKYNKIFK